MLKHWLIELIGHTSGLSEAQLEQIEKALPTTKALIDLLNKAQPIIDQAHSLYIEAEPLIDQAMKEWQTVGPAAQIMIDVISHHVDKGGSPAEAAEAMRAALDGSIKSVAPDHWMDRAMSCVTVFGGTGFLGRRVVHHLRETGATVRIASRHPGDADGDNVKRIRADAHDERSVEATVAGADGVVNAISLYVEHGSETFHSVHVEAAARIASAARRVGAKRLVHLSGIGADAASPSPYIRSRGEGEAAVQAAFPGVVIIRPAVMFAPDDDFLTTILRLLRVLPAYPIFGDGRTRLQPVYADDVAAAITQLLRQSKKPYPIYELAGPRVYSYEELLRTIARTAGLRPVLMRTPFALWHAVAGLAEILPHPPLTRNQVELMQIDTTASDNLPGLRELGISPRSLEEELEAMLKQSDTETQYQTAEEARSRQRLRRPRYGDHTDRPALARATKLGSCNADVARTGGWSLPRFLATSWRGRARITQLSIVARIQEPAFAFHRRRHRRYNGTRRAARAHRCVGAHKFPCRSDPAAAQDWVRRHGDDLRCSRHGGGHDSPRSAHARQGRWHNTIGRCLLR